MLPGLLFTIGLLRGITEYDMLMHATGEFSGRFLLVSLIATPLMILFPKAFIPKWINRNKRYFGLAAFCYGLYHTLAYLVKIPIQEVMAETFKLSMIVGWISFIIWIPMAITSTDGWVSKLKGKWKTIHNWGYLAALLAYLHWALIHDNWGPALIHALPVILLQGYRWWKVRLN